MTSTASGGQVTLCEGPRSDSFVLLFVPFGLASFSFTITLNMNQPDVLARGPYNPLINPAHSKPALVEE